MSLVKTKKLLEWLKENRPNQKFNLEDMIEFLSIALAELGEQNDKTFESLPQSFINDIIELEKASGEYYRLDNQIESLKKRLRISY
jgi:hypothetical protein